MNKFYFLILTFFTINSFGQNNLNVVIETPLPLCNVGDCVDVTANYTDIKTTTSYQVSSITYAPQFPFYGGTYLNATSDDLWTSIVVLPFSFCFYGQNYNQLLVGSNGVVTFDIAGVVPGGNQIPSGICEWSFNTSIPNAVFPIKNAIYGVYQDTDIRTPPVTNPVVQNVNYYVTGTAPNRAFIINFNQLPQFGCGNTAGLQTSQIILNETTNIIDVLISNRSSCTTWNAGSGVVGVQNQAGTLASVPPGRNTGNWSATNEAWRFTPDGVSNTSFSWQLNGAPYSTNNPVTICPTEGDVMQAIVRYTNCNGTDTVLMDDITMHIEPPLPVNNPINLSVCSDGTGSAIFDLTQNNAVILNGLNPLYYTIYYYSGMPSVANSISNTAATTFNSSGQTIYVVIEDNISTGCQIVKTFDLTVNPIPVAPSGDTIQLFTNGETLANVELIGTNIEWYSDENSSSVLPNSTALVHGTTYYASQTNNFDCVSGKTNAGRFAVTVYDVALNTSSFNIIGLSTYPNPVKDMLNLSYTKPMSTVSIHNLLGQTMLTKIVNETQSKIDMSNLSSGTYLVKITVEGLVKTIKVVKQ